MALIFDDDPLIPCEFCDELFPMSQLILHSSGCEINYLQDDTSESEEEETKAAKLFPKEIPNVEIEEIIDVVHATPLTVNKSSTNAPAMPLQVPEEKPVQNITVEIDDSSKLIDEIITLDEANFEEPCLNYDELEKGIKMMEYGRSKKSKSEEEKASFKVPMPLLNNADQKEMETACNSLSDDDFGESLEDYWKRAERKISQKINKRFEF